jgi:ligand-binding sensor domain-containing protein/signal transduction histidine kinase
MATIRMFATVLASFARRTSCRFVCAIAFTLPVLALNPAYRISQYTRSSWRSNAGIQAVRRIKQTPDGYLWLATRSGLMRFDGVHFSTFKAGSEEGLESSTIQDLLIDPDGSMWVATRGGGLAHYQGGKFHTYTLRDGLPSEDIASLFRDSHGTLWVGTRGAGIARMLNGKFEKLAVAIPPATSITAFLEGPDHSLWIAATGYGVLRLQNGILTSFTVKDGLPDNRVDALYRDHAGTLWTAGWKGISFWNGTRFVAHPAINRAVSESQAISCIEDRNGNFWIASSSGLFRARGTEVDRMDRSMGLSGDFVSDVFEDREGNLWVGTRAGLDRFQDGQIQVFTQPGPIVADTQGIWTVSNGQISRLAANTTHAWSVSLPKGSTVSTFLSMRDAGFLIGFDKGARIWTGEHTRSAAELSGLSIRSLLQARDGSIWIGTVNRGLLRWKSFGESRTLTETGVPDKWIVTLAQDRTGAVWAGSTTGGLYRIDEGKVQHFGRDEGFRSPSVYTVFIDNNGELWIGSSVGLSWFQDGQIRTVNSQQGLPADQVFAILEDSFNHIWLLEYPGIVSIDRRSLAQWASGVRHKLDVALYPLAPELQVRTGITFFPSAARSADGHLWFGIADGLCQVTPPNPADAHTPQFRVLVEDVTVDHVAHPEPDRIRIPPGAGSVELRYTALTLSNSEAVRFRYRLEGLDNDWVDAGARRLAFYNNLKPGVYTFRVAASTGKDQWQESPALALYQVPFFYQTWWFRLLASATALSLAFFAYRLRLRQAVDRIQAGFQQRIDERTRVARELHDTLLQSLHALLLSFQRAANVLPDRPMEAKHRLEGAIDQAAQAITESRDAVQGLRSSTVVTNDLPIAIQTLGEELASKQTREEAALFDVAVDGKSRDLNPILRDDVYRIACEALRNAFQHAHARHIEVELHYDERQLRLRIRDDGKGIVSQVLSNEGRSGHWGFEGMRERAKLVGGQLEIWSELDSGTEIELSIPASIAYLTSATRHSRKNTSTNI